MMRKPVLSAIIPKKQAFVILSVRLIRLAEKRYAPKSKNMASNPKGVNIDNLTITDDNISDYLGVKAI